MGAQGWHVSFRDVRVRGYGGGAAGSSADAAWNFEEERCAAEREIREMEKLGYGENAPKHERLHRIYLSLKSAKSMKQSLAMPNSMKSSVQMLQIDG